jgi:GT2 family glycosyltransferase
MLSAIVPTHDRAAVLTDCIKTLLAQEVAADELEIVVVDDGWDPNVSALVAAFTDGPFEMRCERNRLIGLNGARNRGAAVARGEILAFLDDDTLAAPGWARAMLDAFAEYPCAAVGGRVSLGLAAAPPDWFENVTHHLAEYDLGEEPYWLADHPELIPIPVGANFAVRRTEFDRVGGFRTGLDRLGRSLISNGDTEFLLRLRAGGGKLRYEPRASVIHRVPAERLTISYMVRRHYAQGVSDELVRSLQGRSPSLGHVGWLIRGLGGAGKMLCRDAVSGRSTAIGQFLASYWAGRLVSVGRNPKGDEATRRIARLVSKLKRNSA